MTQDERETINRRIAEWLGLCWHNVRPGLIVKCDKCGCIAASVSDNPDYHSKSGFWLLLEGLSGKGIEVVELVQQGRGWPARSTVHKSTAFTATADTLPLALAQATLKLIEQEEKDGK